MWWCWFHNWSAWSKPQMLKMGTIICPKLPWTKPMYVTTSVQARWCLRCDHVEFKHKAVEVTLR